MFEHINVGMSERNYAKKLRIFEKASMGKFLFECKKNGLHIGFKLKKFLKE